MATAPFPRHRENPASRRRASPRRRSAPARPHGVQTMEFVKQYNAATETSAAIIPVEITIYEDRSFIVLLKTPPTPVLMREAAGLEKGALTAGRERVGTITEDQLTEIAKTKMPDLNANDLEAAKRQIAGTARSMGISVVAESADAERTRRKWRASCPRERTTRRPVAASLDRDPLYTPAEAVEVVKSSAKAKFDETVELAVRLGVDPRRADQIVRGTFAARRHGPDGPGGRVRRRRGGHHRPERRCRRGGADDLVERVAERVPRVRRGHRTPDMMGRSDPGRVLGPRGLMPDPKTGTVTDDVEKAVIEFKGGRVEYRTDKVGNVHIRIGKASFDRARSWRTCTVIDEIHRVKPAAAKGRYFRAVTLSSTMGPGVKVDPCWPARPTRSWPPAPERGQAHGPPWPGAGRDTLSPAPHRAEDRTAVDLRCAERPGTEGTRPGPPDEAFRHRASAARTLPLDGVPGPYPSECSVEEPWRTRGRRRWLWSTRCGTHGGSTRRGHRVPRPDGRRAGGAPQRAVRGRWRLQGLQEHTGPSGGGRRSPGSPIQRVRPVRRPSPSSTGDVSAVAKALQEFSKANPNLVIKGGIVGDGGPVGRRCERPGQPAVTRRALAGSPVPVGAGCSNRGLVQAVPALAYGLSACWPSARASLGEVAARGGGRAAPQAETEAAPRRRPRPCRRRRPRDRGREPAAETAPTEAPRPPRGRGHRRGRDDRVMIPGRRSVDAAHLTTHPIEQRTTEEQHDGWHLTEDQILDGIAELSVLELSELWRS